MKSMLRLPVSFLAVVLLLASSSAHAVKKCPSLQEILDQYIRAESPRGPKEWVQRLTQQLKGQAKWTAFMKASEKEFSSENVHFLVAVDTYQQDFSLLKAAEQLNLANAIYDKFIGPDTMNLAAPVFNTLKQWKVTSPQVATKDTFKLAYMGARSNAEDTYARFVIDVQNNGLGKDLSYKNCIKPKP